MAALGIKESEVNTMTLYDYVSQLIPGEEVTVYDKDYDTEFYVYAMDEDDADRFDMAILNSTKAMEIVEFKSNGVTVNLMDVIEDRLEAIEEAGLYRTCTTSYEIMDDINGIYSGYVSEEWMEHFADVLNG